MNEDNQLELAVITGAKAHDVINFQNLFHGLPGINSYIQHIDDFAASPEHVRDRYDAVLFYFMMKEGPSDDGLPGYRGKPKAALEHLGQTNQGIVILHHALLAYPDWPFWSELVGIGDRTLSRYDHDEQVTINVVDQRHPITAGLSDWRMIDETYLMADADDDNQILLSTEHSQSMKTIGWVREHKQNRVFCLQLGHDNQSWQETNFQTVLSRGIRWSCRQL